MSSSAAAKPAAGCGGGGSEGGGGAPQSTGAAAQRPPMVNLNVGVMGHVDSGKTSLVKALSTHLSTASIDKHPQSQERGITLDLGFSSFSMPLPERFQALPTARGVEQVQVTLVDCPGHASLIRTIIGGAHIIDMVLLVVDVTRGIQAQTVECVVIAEVATRSLVIALNKIDLLPEAERAQRVAAQQEAIRRQLRGSPFADAPMIPVAAAVGGEKVAAVSVSMAVDGPALPPPLGVPELVATLRATMPYPVRRGAAGPLYLAVDHCFPIKGQGTVLTGTVLSGRVGVGDAVELPVLGERKKVKSLQVFHRSVPAAAQGDRVGLCVAGLDARLMERGVVCAPGSVGRVERAVAVVKRVRAFRGRVLTGGKVHVSVGHVTVMARATFFGARELWEARRRQALAGEGSSGGSSSGSGGGRDTPSGGPRLSPAASLAAESGVGVGVPCVEFDWAQEFVYQEGLVGREADALAAWGEEPEEGNGAAGGGAGSGAAGAKDGGDANARFLPQFVVLEFDSPVLCPLRSLVIGSRLDAEFGGTGCASASSSSSAAAAAAGGRKGAEAGGGASSNGPAAGGGGGKPCRLAFYGTLLESLKEEDLRRLLVYKPKMREGTVHRLLGEAASGAGPDGGGGRCREATGQGFFKKETDLRPFVGMRVETRDGQLGRIEAGFGQGAKFRVRFDGAGAEGVRPGDRLYLRFRRFLHDPEKRMVQPAQPLPPLVRKPRPGSAKLRWGAGEEGAGDSSGGEEEDGGSGKEPPQQPQRAVPDGQQQPPPPGVVEGVDLSALEQQAAELSLQQSPLQQQRQPSTQQPRRPPPQRSSAAESAPTSSLRPLSAPAPAPPTAGTGGSGGLVEARYGTVDSVRPGDLVIAKGLFTMEEDVRQYVGMRVVLAAEGGGGKDKAAGAEGCVVGPFGKGGKAKVQFSSQFAGEVGARLTLYVEKGP